MKLITVNGPVNLRVDGEIGHTFKRGEAYEVSNDVAKHPYLKQYIATCVDLPSTASKKVSKKEEAPKDQEASKDQVEVVNDEQDSNS